MLTFWECAGLITLAIVLWSCRRSLPAMVCFALVIAVGLLFVSAAAAALGVVLGVFALGAGFGWLRLWFRRRRRAPGARL